MLDWAVAAHCPAHVLLTKADKLSRSKASAVLLATRKDLNGVATVQLFSALKRQGVEEARSVLSEMLGIVAGKKRGPGDR